MIKIKVLPHPELCKDGVEFIANTEESICKQLLRHNVEIEHACDMARACTTCHVIIKDGYKSLGEVDELEEDLLDRAWGVTSQSRLSCQAIPTTSDLVIEIPRYTINHAKEN